MENGTPRKKTFLRNTLIVIGAVVVIVALSSVGNGGNSGGTEGGRSSTPALPTTQQISNSTGISSGDVNGAKAIIGRYGLGRNASSIIARDAADIYAMESSDKYGAVLQQAGVGSLNDIADTLAHLVKVWNVPDTDVSHSLDVIFTGLNKSTFKWNDYTGTLITNGSKMSDYTTLVDGASVLTGLQMSLDSTRAMSVFNSVGDSLENPNSQINVAMGGSGYIRKLVKQGGLLNAIKKISTFVDNAQQ